MIAWSWECTPDVALADELIAEGGEALLFEEKMRRNTVRAPSR